MTTAFRVNYMNIKKSKEVCNDSNNEFEKEIKELEQLLEDLPFHEPINKTEKNDPISQGDTIRILREKHLQYLILLLREKKD